MENQESFKNVMEAWLAQSSVPNMPQRGTLVKGTVIRVDDKIGAWVDISGKCDALIPAKDLKDITLEPGQESLFYVIGAEDVDHRGKTKRRDADLDEICLLSASRAKDWVAIDTAKNDRTRIKVKVDRVRKNHNGGITGVAVKAGPLSGFIPFSLLGVRGRAIEELEHNEAELEAYVHEFSLGERTRLIFDHASVAKEESEAAEVQRTELFATLKPGDIRKGVVRSIKQYGAFVDLGFGLTGLVHTSQQGKPVAVGEEVEVMVLSAERGADSKTLIALSTKQVKQAAFLQSINVGDVLTGKVARVQAFGTFVELSAEHGVDGLIHRSQYNSSTRRGERALTPGDAVRVKVLDVDPKAGRIGLTMREVPQEKL